MDARPLLRGNGARLVKDSHPLGGRALAPAGKSLDSGKIAGGGGKGARNFYQRLIR